VQRENYDAGTLYIGALDGGVEARHLDRRAQARILPHISLEDRAKRVDDAVHANPRELPTPMRALRSRRSRPAGLRRAASSWRSSPLHAGGAFAVLRPPPAGARRSAW
jgi:hypothetical protein